MDDISFEKILPTTDNARAIQKMKLDFLPLSVEAPLFRANPDSIVHIHRQMDELSQLRERFTGVFSRDGLIGYMQVGDWEVRHEMAYAPSDEIPALQQLIERGEKYPPQYKLGIFGLAVSREVRPDDSDAIAKQLLYQATDLALGFGHSAINIEFYENDPIKPIARQEGYLFTGRVNNVLMENRGVMKRLHSKTLDI